MLVDLKPCPKSECGGRAGIYLRYDLPVPRWAVCCSKCGIEMPMTSTSYDAAVTMWNSRIMLDLWRKRPPEDPGHHMVLEKNGEQDGL